MNDRIKTLKVSFVNIFSRQTNNADTEENSGSKQTAKKE